MDTSSQSEPELARSRFPSQVPAGAASFALVCHDPDAPFLESNGTYGLVHGGLATGSDRVGACSYHGAKPTPGRGRHDYVFTLVALDVGLDVEDGLPLRGLLDRVEPHVVGIDRLSTRSLVGAMTVLLLAMQSISPRNLSRS